MWRIGGSARSASDVNRNNNNSSINKWAERKEAAAAAAAMDGRRPRFVCIIVESPYNNQQELAWLEVSARRGTGWASVPQCRLDSLSRWCPKSDSSSPHVHVLCAFCVVLCLICSHPSLLVLLDFTYEQLHRLRYDRALVSLRCTWVLPCLLTVSTILIGDESFRLSSKVYNLTDIMIFSDFIIEKC